MRDWDRIWPVGCLGMVVVVAIIDAIDNGGRHE
jgi:hypothetical protein